MPSRTWGDREPYAHLSSPKEGWAGPNVRAHADYIDPADFPDEWFCPSGAEGSRTMTIDVEAKAKERAVVEIMEVVRRQSPAVSLSLRQQSLNHKGHRGLLAALELTKSR